MFALFNVGFQEIVILGGCFLFIVAPAVVLAIVLPIVLRKRPTEPDDQGPPQGPRSLEEGRRPPPASGGGEGITT
jgi:hypothetical protein